MGNRFWKKWGSLAQGDTRTGAKGTDTFKILCPELVLLISNDCMVTYTNIVADYRAQKYDPNRVRLTARGKPDNIPWRINHKDRGHNHVEITLEQCVKHKNAKYMCLDIKEVYLCAPIIRFE